MLNDPHQLVLHINQNWSDSRATLLTNARSQFHELCRILIGTEVAISSVGSGGS